MKYDEPGLYELTYKATDECGNESYATRTITVEDEPSPYPFVLFTSGNSGEIYVDESGGNVSQSPAVFEYDIQDGDQFELNFIIEDLVIDGSEPRQQSVIGSVSATGGHYEISSTDFSGDGMFITVHGDTTVVLNYEGFAEHTVSWSALTVFVTGESE